MEEFSGKGGEIGGGMFGISVFSVWFCLVLFGFVFFFLRRNGGILEKGGEIGEGIFEIAVFFCSVFIFLCFSFPHIRVFMGVVLRLCLFPISR